MEVFGAAPCMSLLLSEINSKHLSGVCQVLSDWFLGLVDLSLRGKKECYFKI